MTETPSHWRPYLSAGDAERSSFVPIVPANEVSALGPPGWCVYEANFEDAPDVEVFCGGLNSKLPTAAALWRQANLLHFGFEQDPSELDELGRALLANSIDYIARGFVERPLGSVTSPFVGRARPRRIATVAATLRRDGATTADLLEHLTGAAADAVRETSLEQAADWFTTVQPYLRSQRDGRLDIDADAMALGLAIGDTQFPSAVLRRLTIPDDAERSCRLLRRVMPEPVIDADADVVLQWSRFLERHHAHLYFSEAAGHVWLLDPLAAKRDVPSTQLRGEARVAAPSTASWRTLFDGESLNGWHRIGATADYRVESACIVGTTRPRIPNSFLRTDAEFGDFVLEFEFLVDPSLNSGVQLRSELFEGTARGYQCEIDPSARAWTAGIYDERRRGWIADLAHDERARAALQQGRWNSMRVHAYGPRVRSWLNGVPAADLVDGLSLRGFVALQVHGVGDRAEPLEVRWRNLQIRELGAHEWRRAADALDPAASTLFDAGVPWSVRFTLEAASALRLAEPCPLTIAPNATDSRSIEIHRLADRIVVRVDGLAIHDAPADLAQRAAVRLAGRPADVGWSALEVLERVD